MFEGLKIWWAKHKFRRALADFFHHKGEFIEWSVRTVSNHPGRDKSIEWHRSEMHRKFDYIESVLNTHALYVEKYRIGEKIYFVFEGSTYALNTNRKTAVQKRIFKV